jgi:hypothetical protein
VRDPIGRPGCRTRQRTLVTTRLDAALDRVADLAELYHQRWPIETARAHLKTTRRMEVWHGQTVPGVPKGLAVLALVYNVVRLVMWHSARRQPLDVERISGVEARRWLGAPSPGMP